MKYRYLFVMCALFLWTGCYEEEDIQVTEGLEISYSLPQGDHSYDIDIVSWYEKYGFYTLYIYEKKDIYWANTDWSERFEDGTGNRLRVKSADPDYVGKQLEIFRQGFLELYPDSLLMRYMPLKVLLCSELWDTQSMRIYDWNLGVFIDSLVFNKMWAYEGWDYIAVNGGSQEVDTMRLSSKSELQASVNAIFLKCLNERGVIEITEEFVDISDYTYAYLMGDQAFARGFITRAPLSNDIKAAQRNDFSAYLKLVCMSIDQLEASPDRRYDYDYAYDMSLVGALHPTRDVNGLVRRKYDVLINMLKEMGINTDQIQYPDFE